MNFWETLTPAYDMLMIPIKDETAVHVYYCPGDMVMRKVLAIPRGWCCSLLLFNLTRTIIAFSHLH